MVLTDDGRMVYVADLVDAANSEQPPTLRVAGGPAVASDTLLENLQPIAEPARVRCRLAAVARDRPAALGRRQFRRVRPWLNRGRPFPTGPLLPTALGLGTPPLLENAQALFDGNGDADQGGKPSPDVECDRHIEREAGSITVTPLFASAGLPFAVGEAARLPDAQINGVDQRNLTVGQSGDAAIVFGSEFAAFVNTLGVFLIRPNGEMVDPKIVFPEIEQAEPDPDFPILRPGGGPVAAGEQVLLSDLYDPASCSRDRNSVCS